MLFHAEIEDLQLTDFLKWLTGASQLPPLGFPKKYGIKFVHECKDGVSVDLLYQPVIYQSISLFTLTMNIP